MEFKNHKPIFLQIAEHICDEILRGLYPEGDRLPSVREYAAEVEVNFNTVARSFEWLSQKDIIFNKRGLGYFVTKGAKKQILKERKKTFMKEKLPELFRQMQLLGITLEDVKVAYDLQQNEHS